MTSATPAGQATVRLSASTAVRRTLARRPEVWVYAVAAGAGVLLLVWAVVGIPADAPAEQEVSWSAAWAAWVGWLLMVLAMMLPVVAPQARQVALRSLRRRRRRAVLGYLSGYLAVWSAVGLALVGGLHAIGQPHPPAGVTVAALVIAACWQTSRARRRVLRRCGSVRLGAPRGFAADRDCAAAGVRSGLRCTFTCGPVMLAMGVGHHYLALMAALLVLLLTERARGPNPEQRAGRSVEAWGLLGCAALVSVTAA